jgi:predicted N-acetyltransferase YhbS
MNLVIRLAEPGDRPTIDAINLEAFAPIHRSFRQILGDQIYDHVYPDWQVSQQGDLDASAAPETATLWVAELDGHVVGFMVTDRDDATKTGQIAIIAAQPEHHGAGIGSALIAHGEHVLRDAGMRAVYIGTGGDPSHAAARRCYERAGYVGVPGVHYYRYIASD